jgi:hypothetical protein
MANFNGEGVQTIPDFDFYYMIVSNAGIKYIPGSTTVSCRTIDIQDDASVEINADGGENWMYYTTADTLF